MLDVYYGYNKARRTILNAQAAILKNDGRIVVEVTLVGDKVAIVESALIDGGSLALSTFALAATAPNA